jgi:predicted amidophosphoribosyltransferase
MRPEDLLRGAGGGSNPNLKSCDACGHDMAKGARMCPHCGKTYSTAGGVFIAVILGLILGGFFMWRG